MTADGQASASIMHMAELCASLETILHVFVQAVAAWVSATSSQTASTVELTIHKKSGRPVPVRVSTIATLAHLALQTTLHLVSACS